MLKALLTSAGMPTVVKILSCTSTTKIKSKLKLEKARTRWLSKAILKSSNLWQTVHAVLGTKSVDSMSNFYKSFPSIFSAADHINKH